MELKSGSKYERLRKIGIGSYGVVFKCVNRQSGQVVAIKRYSENDSDPIIRKIAMREVRMLRQLKHPNLINLIEVFRRKRRLHLVFDYCELTVLDVIEKYTSNCPLNLIRKIIWQTVNGINYCHTHNCIHRDIKPENILINQSGIVKLCDFGFARSIKSSASLATANSERLLLLARDSQILDNANNSNSETINRDESSINNNNNNEKTDRQAFTEYVATRWYRAPELLIGEIYYDIKIDIWAIGCVTAELMRGEPIWPGKTDLDQLFIIKSSLGPLTQSQTHTLLSQGIYNQVNIERLLDQAISSSDAIERKLPARVGQSGIDFVTACLQMDPAKRPTSGELLNHDYIYSARMAQFIQRDNSIGHHLPPIGDRNTVTLPSLSPTINRTNSQSLMLLTSTQQQQQQQQHQHRPTKRFVVATSDSPNRSTPMHERKNSSIPMAVLRQSNQAHHSRLTQIPNPVRGGGGAEFAENPAEARKYKRKQPTKSNNMNINNLAASTLNLAGNSKQQAGGEASGLETVASKSFLPVARARNSREGNLSQRAQANGSPPELQQFVDHQQHHPLRVSRLTGNVDAANEEKPPKRRGPATKLVAQPKGTAAAAAQKQAADAKLVRNGSGATRDYQLNHSKENSETRASQLNQPSSLLKAKRMTNGQPAAAAAKATGTESSASSSAYSDSLGVVRSSSIAFMPSTTFQESCN